MNDKHPLCLSNWIFVLEIIILLINNNGKIDDSNYADAEKNNSYLHFAAS